MNYQPPPGPVPPAGPAPPPGPGPVPPAGPPPPPGPDPFPPPGPGAVPGAAPDVLGRRIGAALLDAVVLAVVFILVGLVFGKAHTSSGSAGVNLTGVSALVYFAIVFAYYCVPEAMSGQTLGKRLLGIRVRRMNGQPAGGGPAAVRTLLRIVDGLPFLYLLGLIVILATGAKRQRIGDLAAGTTVVRA